MVNDGNFNFCSCKKLFVGGNEVVGTNEEHLVPRISLIQKTSAVGGTVGKIMFDELLGGDMIGVSLSNGNIIIDSSVKRIIKVEVENMVLTRHDGSFTLGLYVNDVLKYSILYRSGVGLEPSYGFRQIVYNKVSTESERLDVRIISVSEVKEAFIHVCVY